MNKNKLKRLNIEMTSKCNFNCVGCPSKNLSRGIGNMDPELFYKIFEEIGDSLEVVYLWNYGESLIHPKAPEMLEKIRDFSCKKILSTNGFNLIDFENLNFLTVLDELIISINGLTQEVYEFHQKGGDLNKVLRGVRRVSKLLKGTKTKLILQFVVNKKNLQEVKSVDEFAKNYGFNRVYIKKFNVMSKDKDILKKFVPMGTEYSRYIDNSLKTKPTSDVPKPCKDWIVINWDGTVNPCCWDYRGENILGDLNRKSVQNIWDSNKCINHLTKISKNQFHKFCVDCTSNVYRQG